MKKALILVVLIVTPTMAFAQGTITFNNATGLVKQWTSVSDSTLINVPQNGGYVQLISAPVGTPLHNANLLSFSSLSSFLAANPDWSLPQGNPPATPINVAAGLFNGGTLTLQGIPGGANAEYIIVVWTGNFTTFEAALANPSGSSFGLSAIATTATGNPALTPPRLPVSLRSTFGGCVVMGWGWLDPHFDGFTAQPTNQTVPLGATATFYVGAASWPGPYYQWYFNGASIPGATASSFQISNARLTNAGTYWAELGNAWGVFDSWHAILTVLAPPIFTTPPQSQTAVVGSTVDLGVRATGASPLAYQWFFNGDMISGAGNTDLQLTSVSATQAGTYTVVVTNAAGAVTSGPAMLSVIPPVERRSVPGLSLRGQPGSVLNLEGAEALGPSPAWATLDSVILTNTSQWYFDVATPLAPQRFYRAWQAGGPSAMPTLDSKLVPGLTLTGPVGGTVRLDYINQFGPTDAWVTLGTVTLSNTPQLYFDVSAPGQPPRLYHLVQVP